MAAANKTVWGIHTMDDPLFLNQNLIAIGWEEMGDLSAISTSRDAYKEKYIEAYPRLYLERAEQESERL